VSDKKPKKPGPKEERVKIDPDQVEDAIKRALTKKK